MSTSSDTVLVRGVQLCNSSKRPLLALTAVRHNQPKIFHFLHGGFFLSEKGMMAGSKTNH